MAGPAPGLSARLRDISGLLARRFGRPDLCAHETDPVRNLVLTILSQNTADLNSERAFEALRAAYPSGGPVTTHRVVGPDGTEAPPEGWGGIGLAPGAPPDSSGNRRGP